MSEEDFLKRWSRRKRDVATAENAAPAAKAKPVENKDAVAEPDAEAQAKIEAALPPLESITQLSDVTAFLKAGVPADLTRAALRRAWTVDPAIRDFIGLAENSWDFTDPAAMPGFGPLEDSEEVRRMIAHVVDQIGKAPKPAADEALKQAENSHYSSEMEPQQSDEGAAEEQILSDQAKTSAARNLGTEVLLQSNEENAASQHDVAEAEEEPKHFVHRGHGRALPR